MQEIPADAVTVKNSAVTAEAGVEAALAAIPTYCTAATQDVTTNNTDTTANRLFKQGGVGFEFRKHIKAYKPISVVGGVGANQSFYGDDGTEEAGGSGALNAGDGGGHGQDGGNGLQGQLGGLKGNCLHLNSGTINIVTICDTLRFIQGGGDAPSSINQ
jgi:hypothetical protein